jgi:hypothetical protein
MTRDTSAHPNRVYMQELEELLNRQRTTIRKWERDGILPVKLKPKRDEAGWRYWTLTQAIGLAKLIVARELYPGKGFAGEAVMDRHRQDAQARLDHITELAEQRRTDQAAAV